MDIVQDCRTYINDQLASLNKYVSQHVDPEKFHQTQTKMDSLAREKRMDLDKIFEQHFIVKGLIDKDEEVRSLRRQIREDKKTIENIRRSCTRLSAEAAKQKHELIAEQSKELEKYQLNLMKEVADAQSRYKNILTQRENELASLKAEYQREEDGRQDRLDEIEQNLKRSIEDRQRMLNEPGNIFGLNANRASDSSNNRVDLITVDEYAPYGNDPPVSGPKKRARGARKTGQANATGKATPGTGGPSTRGRSRRAHAV